jgi:hypothetical protein
MRIGSTHTKCVADRKPKIAKSENETSKIVDKKYVFMIK